jgi:CTP:molybdopterin cytidylyltransferase MocA
VLVSKAVFPEIEALHGDKGVWRLLEAHPEWVQEIELDLPASLTCPNSGTDV